MPGAIEPPVSVPAVRLQLGSCHGSEKVQHGSPQICCLDWIYDPMRGTTSQTLCTIIAQYLDEEIRIEIVSLCFRQCLGIQSKGHGIGRLRRLVLVQYLHGLRRNKLCNPCKG